MPDVSIMKFGICGSTSFPWASLRASPCATQTSLRACSSFNKTNGIVLASFGLVKRFTQLREFSIASAGLFRWRLTSAMARSGLLGAHETEHFLLHPAEVFHRDRPVSNVHAEKRPTREQEADYFAACFLASEKLLRQEFELRFGRVPLSLNDTVAYHLSKKRMQDLLRAPTGSLEFPAAAAGARSFAGKGFMSLADRFGVSIPAMAIRLQELGLVDD